jgi:alpha-glucosidase (family GH31 glycosyl hydrolase)
MTSRTPLPSRPIADPRAVVVGPTYRITVLTDGLVRLEHSPDGVFEDRASTFALHRELPVPEFRVIESPTHVEVVTARFHLVYDRQPFSTSGLSLAVLGGISSYHSVWRYGEDATDLGGTARTLDLADGAIPLEPGVVSRRGFAVLDDSRSMLFDDEGWVAPRDGSRTDLYVFAYGLDHRAAVQALYTVSGPTPLLPRFALGSWWSRFHRYTADSYAALLGSPTRACRSAWPCSTWTGTSPTSTRRSAAAGPATPGTAPCSRTLRRSWPRCTSAVCA